MSKTILIVDDSVSILELLKLTLEDEGYKVLSAVDGKDALKYFTGKYVIDLLLTDLHMPNMNGIELIKEVRKKDKFKYMPILFLTTETKIETKKEKFTTACPDFYRGIHKLETACPVLLSGNSRIKMSNLNLH